jgi:hypothetical protein
VLDNDSPLVGDGDGNFPGLGDRGAGIVGDLELEGEERPRR